MKRISAYSRPDSIGDALALLERPGAVLIGGGTKLRDRRSSEPISVVDLQATDLDRIERLGTGVLRIGATATLQQLVDSEYVPPVIREAARRELPSTLRAQSTLGGTIVSADWESELLAALLVHDAVVSVARAEGTEQVGLDALLAQLPLSSHGIVTAVVIETGGAASLRERRAHRLTDPSSWRWLAWGPTGADGSPSPGWRRLLSWWRPPTSSIHRATSADPANTAAGWRACSFLVRSRGCPDGVEHHTERRHTWSQL